jgi:hypothetical protein
LTRLTAVLAGAVIVPLAALTAPFVALWVGPEQYAGDLVVGLAVFNGVLLPVFSLWGWVFTGTGRVGVLLPYMVGQGVLNLGASLVATWLFGVPGPLIGTALVNLVYNPWLLGRLLHGEFGVSPRAVISATLLPLVPAALILGGLAAVRVTWPGEYSWWRLAAEFAACAALYLIVAWRLVLGDGERRAIRGLAGRKSGRTSS